MFGFVAASIAELTEEEKRRYNAVYCGICRQIRDRSGNLSRLGLSYDMAFLALLLTSLYEPKTLCGDKACILHPIRQRPWLDNEYIRYAADMNVALGYYNALDNWKDDKRLSAGVIAGVFKKSCKDIEARFPRQCEAMAQCIARLSELEKENCATPDEPANCFGALMAELLVYREDLWAPTLRQMGHALGRFIYLADAAIDYRQDLKQKKYNPYIAMGTGSDWKRWEDYLVLAMARCTDYYERLPLVQDKPVLDNILYSGIWLELRRRQKEQHAQEETHDR